MIPERTRQTKAEDNQLRKGVEWETNSKEKIITILYKKKKSMGERGGKEKKERREKESTLSPIQFLT